MSSEHKKITLKCPICGQSLIIDISSIALKPGADVATLTIVHGSPPHTILVYINDKGEVVNIEPIKQTVLVEEKITEPVVIKLLSIKEIAELFGVESIAYILSAVKKGKPVYFLSGKKYDWALEIATSILISLKLKIEINVNKTGREVGFYVVDEDFYKKNRERIEKYLIFATTGGAMGTKPKLDKKVLNLLKEKFKMEEKKENLSDIFF